MKKFFKLFCFVLLVMFISNDVYAQTFTCDILGDSAQFDYQLAKIVKYVILIIQIVVPIILVVMGLLDFLKAVAAQKEDDIKAGQKLFIKRLLAGVLVFFVIALVKLVISIAANSSSDGIMNCASCFIDGPKSSSCG